MNFLEEVKAAVEGRWFKPKKKKKVYKTAEEIYAEELEIGNKLVRENVQT